MQIKNFVIHEMVPVTELYFYTSNFQNNKKLEIKYGIEIITITNIIFIYKLYKHEEQFINVFLVKTIIIYREEIYLRKTKTNYYEFGYISDETNINK